MVGVARFEWDPVKAEANFVKHGVRFEEAVELFSSGVDYLESTLKYRIFTDLWTVRTILLPRRALPELSNPEFYGFHASKDLLA